MLVSDVDIDIENNYVIAETSFNKSGRIIKVDQLGSIIFSTGEGSYSIINSIYVQSDNNMVIST